MISATQSAAIDTVSIMRDAQQVLNSPNSTVSTPNSSVWQGKHWSYYFQLAGAVAGAAIAISGLVLQTGAFLAMGGVLLVTNGIGAYYDKEFAVLTALGTLVNLLTIKVKEIAKELSDLQQINKDFSTANDSLKKDVEKAQKVFEEGSSNLKDKIKELQDVKMSLEDTEKKMAGLSILYENLKISTNHFSDEMKNFIVQSLNFKETGQMLSTEVNKIDGENDELKGLVKNFDAENSEFVEENKQLAKFNDNFTLQLQQMKKMSEEDRNLNSDLKKKIELLSQRSLQVDSTTHKLEEAQAKADKSEHQMEELLKELDEVKEMQLWVHYMKDVLTKEQYVVVANKIKHKDDKKG